MSPIKRKVIGIAVAAAGVLAAAIFLLWPRHKAEKTNEMIRESVIRDQSTVTDDLSVETDNEEETNDHDVFGNMIIDFDKLREKNPDIVAWIEVEGTGISYPVLQSSGDEPEDYYLTHDVDRHDSKHGAIYMQKRNSPQFKDFMTVLYGHNMRDGTMFRQLHNFKDPSFLKERDRIVIYLPNDKKKQYKIVSAEITSDENILDAYDDFKDLDIAEAYRKELEVDEFRTSFLALSTCCGEKERRLIVYSVESE